MKNLLKRFKTIRKDGFVKIGDNYISLQSFNVNHNNLSISYQYSNEEEITLTEDEKIIFGSDTVKYNIWKSYYIASYGKVYDDLSKYYINDNGFKEITIKDNLDNIEPKDIVELVNNIYTDSIKLKIIDSTKESNGNVVETDEKKLEILKKYNISKYYTLEKEYIKEKKGVEINKYYIKGFSTIPSANAIKKEIASGKKKNIFIENIKKYIDNNDYSNYNIIKENLVNNQISLMNIIVDNEQEKTITGDEVIVVKKENY